MNNVTLIGNLTRDPELSYTQNTQTAICRFTIAVNRPKRNGEDQGADFIRIVVWNKQGENCDRYLKKGSPVAVVGRIQTGSYTNRDGQTVNTTEIVADRVEFLSSGQRSGQSNGYAQRSAAPAAEPTYTQPEPDFGFDVPDSFQAAEEDIPF